MRRTTLLALAAVVGLTVIPATAAAQLGKFVGISGGATSSDMRGGFTNTSSRWGGTAGVFVGYRNWHTAGVLEANWVQKGGGDTRIDYIEVPFLIGGATETPSGFLFRVYTGIGIGFPISCSSTLEDCNQKKSPEWTWPIGLLIGKSMGNGPTFTAVDVRYSIGLSDTFNNAFSSNYSWQFRLFVGRRI
jgi:hypothetical protein